MRCPFCRADDDRVVDSRPSEEGAAIRRRRECLVCGQRFSTYERAELPALMVRKRSGLAEPFERAKVLAGLQKATKNLPMAADEIGTAAAQVEKRLRALERDEVTSEEVGAEVLVELRSIDPVAYVRFAAVYKGFTTPEDFARELAHLEKDTPPKRPERLTIRQQDPHGAGRG